MAIKRLSKVLDLELAWRRVKKDQYDDFVPDILELRDIDHDKAQVIDSIKEALDRGYIPSDMLQVDAPKRGYTLRPCGYMTPEDRIVYQAVVDSISRRVKEPPQDCVFSHRLNEDLQSKSMFQFWRDWWLKWRKEMRATYSKGYCCLLRTDITAYYEQIDHRTLRYRILNGEVKDKRILDLLDLLLRKWSLSGTRNIGIPQGYDASSFLGNVYLIDLDKTMKRQNFKYYRYADEIYVFTKDEREARRAIKEMTHVLRALHLNLQEAKTGILTDPQKIAKEIGDDEEDKRRIFDYEFKRKVKTSDEEASEEEVKNKYKQITAYGKAQTVDTSDFKWCINKLRRLKNDTAVGFILKRLAQMPFLADIFFEYLQIFANRKKVKEGIINFLASEDNIYEWQEMWLLLTLSKAKKLEDHQLDNVRAIVRDKFKSKIARAAGILALAKLGDGEDRKWLADLFLGEDNDYIRRAIVVGIHGLPKPMRNTVYSGIENDCPAIKRLVNYLREKQEIQTI